MKVLLSPLLVVALALQAAGSFGGAFFCRSMGERLADCCCPDEEQVPSGPMLVSAACCDLLRGVAPGAPAQERAPSAGKFPARSVVAVDVALPGPSLAVVDPPATVASWPRASGPPGTAPVFLSLKQLLL